jgi:hypothetical protein
MIDLCVCLCYEETWTIFNRQQQAQKLATINKVKIVCALVGTAVSNLCIEGEILFLWLYSQTRT